MMKKKIPKRPAAEVPTGLLDAYTEGSSTSSMSDSDKFKEGYVKKKDKVKKRTNKKSETEEVLEVKEDEEAEVQDSWDAEEEVIDSWDQMEVAEMPVPQKVKQAMRKEEKKRKKEEQKKASNLTQASDRPSEDTAVQEIESEHASVSVKEKTPESKVPGDNCDIVKKMEIMTVSTEGEEKPPKRDYTEEEKTAIKAEREAKKAAKANKKGNKKTEKDASLDSPASVALPGDTVDKTKEQLKAERKAAFELQQKKKAEAAVGTEAAPADGDKSKAELKAERRAKQEAQRAAKEATQKKAQEVKQSKESKIKVPEEIKADDKKAEKKLNKVLKDQNVPARTKVQRQVGLFSHLHQYERELSVTKHLPVVGSNIHPEIVKLGLQVTTSLVANLFSILMTLSVIMRHFNFSMLKER